MVVNSFEELPSKEEARTNLDIFYELVNSNQDIKTIVDPAWKDRNGNTLFEEAARRGNVKMVEYLVTTPKYASTAATYRSDIRYRAEKRLKTYIGLLSDIPKSYKILIIQDYVLSEKRGEVGIEGWEDGKSNLVVMKDRFDFKDDEYMRKIALRFLDNYFAIILILDPTIKAELQPLVDSAKNNITRGGSKRKTKHRRKRSKKSRARRK